MEKFKKIISDIKTWISTHKKESIICLIASILLIAVICVILLNNKKEPKPLVTTSNQTSDSSSVPVESESETEPETEVNHDGDVISKLTGDWIDKKLGKKRPVAIMINNISDAIPQSGISKASVIYEVPVEGGMTRLMALFEDYKDIKRIGSIRSCRLYFCYFANEFDAIYVHFGQSKYAEDYLNSDAVENVSGLSAIGNVTFWRADDKISPHDVYTNYKKLESAIDTLGYKRKYDKKYKGKFKFADVDGDEIKLKGGNKAYKVTINYPITAPWFEYDKDTGLYSKFQYGDKHIDESNNEQLTFKNIIVQYVNYGLYPDNKSLDMTVTGTGDGYYITNGKCVPITWEKDELDDITKYYNEDGEEITFNVGKTYVGIVGYNVSLSLKGKKGLEKDQKARKKAEKKAKKAND